MDGAILHDGHGGEPQAQEVLGPSDSTGAPGRQLTCDTMDVTMFMPTSLMSISFWTSLISTMIEPCRVPQRADESRQLQFCWRFLRCRLPHSSLSCWLCFLQAHALQLVCSADHLLLLHNLVHEGVGPH